MVLYIYIIRFLDLSQVFWPIIVKISSMKYVEVIKQLMMRKKLSQIALAKMIGVNQTTISQWLLGHKKPNYDNIYAFYEKFGITPNEFFGIEEIF